MAMTASSEIRRALTGALRLARGDRGGLAYFEPTIDGFWRSFRAGFLAYPLFLALLAMRTSGAAWTASGGVQIILVETIGYVIAWAAFPLAMLKVSELMGRERRFFTFMVAYNWAQVPQSALFVLVALEAESGLFGAGGTRLIGLAAAFAALAYEWFIARVGLEVSGLFAALVVFLDLLLTLLVSITAAALY